MGRSTAVAAWDESDWEQRCALDGTELHWFGIAFDALQGLVDVGLIDRTQYATAPESQAPPTGAVGGACVDAVGTPMGSSKDGNGSDQGILVGTLTMESARELPQR